MSKHFLLALSALAVSITPVFGQESQPSTTTQAGEPSAPDDFAAEVAAMTLEEMVAEAYKALQKAETRGPDAQAALERVDRLLGVIRRRDPLNNDADFLKGRAQLLLGRPREAIGAITSYVSSPKGANDWLAFKFLGDLYIDAKYYTMARDKYQRAVDLNPREAEPYAGLAGTELKLNRPNKAVEYAKKAIDLQGPAASGGRDPRFYSMLAQALLADRKPDEASTAATAAVELARQTAKNDPTDPSLLAKLDSHNALLEQIIGAIIQTFPAERTEEYARLARVQQERAEIAHLLSLHRILKTLDQGIERSAAAPPPALVFEKAKVLIAVGNADEAAQVLTDLLAKHPDHAEARALLDSLQPPQAATSTRP